MLQLCMLPLNMHGPRDLAFPDGCARAAEACLSLPKSRFGCLVKSDDSCKQSALETRRPHSVLQRTKPLLREERLLDETNSTDW